jgi:hypothetical protein
VVVTASAIDGLDPLLRWTLAVIAGGGVAGVVKVAASTVRGASSLATAGLANFLVASGEAVGSLALSLAAILLPLLALALVAVAVLVTARRVATLRRRRVLAASG